MHKKGFSKSSYINTQKDNLFILKDAKDPVIDDVDDIVKILCLVWLVWWFGLVFAWFPCKGYNSRFIVFKYSKGLCY